MDGFFNSLLSFRSSRGASHPDSVTPAVVMEINRGISEENIAQEHQCAP